MLSSPEKPTDTTLIIRATHTDETLERSPSLGQKFKKNEQGYLILSLMKMVEFYQEGELNFNEITSLIFAIGQEARHFDLKRTVDLIEDDIFFVLDARMRTTEGQEQVAQHLKDNLIKEVNQLTNCMTYFSLLKQMYFDEMKKFSKTGIPVKNRQEALIAREDIQKLQISLFENLPMERAKKYRDLFEDEKYGRFKSL